MTRISLNNVTVDELLAMEKETEAAAQLLKDANVDVIVYACTSGSLLKGAGHDIALAKRITQVAGCPAIVTAGAIVEALKYLQAQRIALATPYTKIINMKEIDFLRANGFEVAFSQSLNIKKNIIIGRLSPSDAAALAIKADSNLADVLFISCTNLRTFEVIAQLEEQLQKPVISSNSATLWAALRLLKPNFNVSLGSLFSVKQTKFRF